MHDQEYAGTLEELRLIRQQQRRLNEEKEALAITEATLEARHRHVLNLLRDKARS